MIKTALISLIVNKKFKIICLFVILKSLHESIEASIIKILLNWIHIGKILKGIGSTVSNVHIMYRVSTEQNNMRNRDDFPEIVLLNWKTPSPGRDPKIENELKRKKWKEMREFLLWSAYNKVKLFKNHMDFELDNSDNEKEDSNLAFNPQINAQK